MGGEVFDFNIGTAGGGGGIVFVVFSAGTFTLQQVRDVINAAAISAGFGFMPCSINEAGTALALSSEGKESGEGITIVVPNAQIGFASATISTSTPPTEVGIKGSFISQFSPAVSDVEIKGIGTVVSLAGGN